MRSSNKHIFFIFILLSVTGVCHAQTSLRTEALDAARDIYHVNLQKPANHRVVQIIADELYALHSHKDLTIDKLYVERNSTTLEKYILQNVNEYMETQFTHDFTDILFPFFSKYASYNDIINYRNAIFSHSVSDALSKVDETMADIDFGDEDYWYSFINEVMDGDDPKMVKPKYSSIRYMDLFQEFFDESEIAQVFEAAFDSQLRELDLYDSETEQSIDRCKELALNTFKVKVFNEFYGNVPESVLMTCIDFYNQPEYDNCISAITATMEDIIDDPDELVTRLWEDYQEWYWKWRGLDHYIEYFVEEKTDNYTYPVQLIDKKPTFNGGDANEFSKWVNSHLIYPELAKENGVQGLVIVQFTVSYTGQVRNVSVLRSAFKDLDNEAVRVVSSSPLWEPGRLDGKLVNVTYTFPVIFQLQ